MFLAHLRLVRTIRVWVFILICSVAYFLLRNKEVFYHRARRSFQDLTVDANNIAEKFPQSERDYFLKYWNLQRARRFDYASILEPCKNHTKWQSYYRDRNASMITSAQTSQVYLHIKPAGQYSRMVIEAYSLVSTRKRVGGDSWRVFIRGDASMPITVVDHTNGTYEMSFLITKPGLYYVELFLEYTLCDGYKEPPDDWFIRGNDQGKSPPDSVLPGYEKPYLEERVDKDLSFEVENGQWNMFEELLPNLQAMSTERNDPSSPSCLMWDGFGEWNKQLQWTPYLPKAFHLRYPKPKQHHRGVFWIFGDSVGDFFYRAVWNTPLCKTLFRSCGRSYNWIYILPNGKPPKSSDLPYDFKDFDVERVISGLTEVLSRTTMNNESALLINFGLHYSMSISISLFEQFIARVVDTFTKLKSSGVYNGTIIWKTTTAMQKWKFGRPESNGRHAKSHRFLTEPRTELFNAISSNKMCDAGFPVLDIFPLSYSYPNGTGTILKPWDAVHYSRQTFLPVEEYLFSYFDSTSPAGT